MAANGRPPKPIEQKRALGNPGKRALPRADNVVILEPAYGVPEPARPLLEVGRSVWDRLWSAGATWISPATDAEFVLLTCEAIDERALLRAEVMASGDDRQRRGLRDLEKQIAGNLGQLGFSPADRSRLGVAEVKIQSKLAALHELKAARVGE